MIGMAELGFDCACALGIEGMCDHSCRRVKFQLRKDTPLSTNGYQQSSGVLRYYMHNATMPVVDPEQVGLVPL